MDFLLLAFSTKSNILLIVDSLIFEAVAVMLFYQVGETFQSYAVKKSRKSIASLMDIRPDYANLYIDGKVKKVNPNIFSIIKLILTSFTPSILAIALSSSKRNVCV